MGHGIIEDLLISYVVRERERERERERSTIMKEYLILKCEHSDTKTLKNG
jgi:hypothetical protein